MTPFQMDAGMILPNEMFVDVLCYVDYRTLVFARLAHEHFRLLVMKCAAQLAHRRSFRVSLDGRRLVYAEAGQQRRKVISYETGNQQSLAAACRRLAERVVGPHAVSQLAFDGHTWNTLDVDVVFDAAPQMKYAEQVELFSPDGATISGDSAAFMSNFAAMKELRVWFDYEVFRQFDWTFLRRECARELRCVRLTRLAFWTEAMNRSVEELVHHCVALQRLRGGGDLEFDFSDNIASGAFGRRIIEVGGSETLSFVLVPVK